jgi:cellulose synthase/poly-beta-1,6-N-acetylglucosamine synthase-like glycosyltransferase
MKLAVVVPATDSPSTLARCLDALAAADEPPDEVIVVDQPRFAGPASARNLGAARSTSELIAFVDADVIVAPDAFARIREHFRRDPELVAVFGSYDDSVVTRSRAARFRNLLHHHVHTRSAGPATTFWAGLGAVRRGAFEEVGGFDEVRYPRPSIEDVELGMRLADKGARIRLDPYIRGTHLKDWTLARMVQTDFAGRGVPWVHLLLERREAPTTLNLGWRERVSAIAAVASTFLVLRGRFGRAAGAAAVLVVLNLPFYRLLRQRLGGRDAALSVPIHIAHHLAAVAAVPVGVLTHFARRDREGNERDPPQGRT